MDVQYPEQSPAGQETQTWRCRCNNIVLPCATQWHNIVLTVML